MTHGKDVWHKNNCINCHTLFGERTYYAPQLATIAKFRPSSAPCVGAAPGAPAQVLLVSMRRLLAYRQVQESGRHPELSSKLIYPYNYPYSCMATAVRSGDAGRMKVSFEWDAEKESENRQKHGVSFREAQYAFADRQRIIAKDLTHTTPEEPRFYCFGKVGEGILTVRFTWRRRVIRIFGAGYWRKGKRIYERENQI